MTIRCYSQTDVGQVRSDNEDCMGWDPTLQVAVLADGMGGLNAGEVASAAAVDAVLDRLKVDPADARSVRSAMTIANERVLSLSRDSGDAGGMGTTLVVWGRIPGTRRCVIGNVGDSRVYRWRGSALEQMTHDHSVVQQLVDQGLITTAEARVAPNRNVITRAVGIDTVMESDVDESELMPGDWYVLCSDGVTDMITDEELGELLANADEPDRLPAAVVSAANRRGGVDNISIMVVVVDDELDP